MPGAQVHGEVLLPTPSPPLERAVLVVRVEDSSLADAPARTVAQDVLTGLAARAADGAGGGGLVPFALGVAEFDPRTRYTLRVHLDVDGDGVLGPGDYINTVSIPVLTHGHPTRVRVPLRCIE